jgi:hypothetical protein
MMHSITGNICNVFPHIVEILTVCEFLDYMNFFTVFSAFGSTPQPSLFGAGQPSAFGASAPGTAAAGNTGLFGATASFMGGGGMSGSGTTVKFVPVTGSDVVMKGGSQQTVQTKLQCITGMKEYENKSLEVQYQIVKIVLILLLCMQYPDDVLMSWTLN